MEETLNLLTSADSKYKKKLSCVMCHAFFVTCHLSPITCHLTTTLCSFSGYEGPRMLHDAAEEGLVIDRERKKKYFFLLHQLSNLP